LADRVFVVQKDDHDRRIDRIIRRVLPETNLSQIYRLIRQGKTRLNGRRVKPSVRVKEGDRITIKAASEQPPPVPASGAAGRSDGIKEIILFENRNLLVLNKPRGFPVHGPGSIDSTVRNYLSAGLPPSLSFRPGPVHRLDRNTTGVLIFSKSLLGARRLSRILRERKIDKYYITILDGEFGGEEAWHDRLTRNHHKRKTYEDPEHGRSAVTHVFPLMVEKGISLILIHIETGRTHQIRAQAALHHHPLTGDSKYRGSSLIPFYFLHAAAVRIVESDFDLGFRAVTAPLPLDSSTVISTLFGYEALKLIEQSVKAHVSI
jgi:23S rRNA pseudouridine955/2504/2580 synthase